MNDETVALGPRKKSYNRRQVKRSSLSSRVAQRQKHPSTTFQVDFSIPGRFRATVSRNWIIQSTAEALWQHWMYCRGLLPIPHHQILASAPEKIGGREVKRVKENMLSLIYDWRTILSSKLEVQHILLVLGPGWNRPKEVYVVDFTRISVDGTSNQSSLNDDLSQKQYQLSTRIIREVVRAEFEAEEVLSSKELSRSVQRALSDHFMIGISVTRDSYQRCYDHEYRKTDNEQALVSSTCALEKLIMRRDFDLGRYLRNLQRTGFVNVLTKNHDGCEETNDLIWLSLRSSVKGFRLST